MKCVCFLQRTAIRTLSKIISAGKSKSSGMPVLLRDTSSTLSRERNAQENIEKVERHNSLIWDCGFFYIQKSEGVRSMAVFRIERTRDYTVMSNHHLRNANLSLKAKGLLSMMLSLPEDWNYTTRGLAKICKEGVDAIGAALRELEAAGYIVRHKLRDRQGRISDTEYVIYEQPQLRKTAKAYPANHDAP